ncbi:MAG TPA: right-handed parallel beta-helix repeat-containing protein [Thermoanaerobaculia bacterium]|nr:right-handed parallel beta-helix repeat-containing protein [Thermoanaerobaculia bacterium]
MRVPALVLSLLVSSSLFAAAVEVAVTNTNDSGPGSLRAAIEEVNAAPWFDPRVIFFSIAGPVPAEGFFTIRPQSPLPYIAKYQVSIDAARQAGFTGNTNPNGPEVVIDGSDAGLTPGLKFVRAPYAFVLGLGVTNFQGNGIVVDGNSGTQVIGCTVTNNGANGILFIRHGLSAISGNVVTGNRGNGILLRESVGLVSSNFIADNGASGVDIAAPMGVHNNTITRNALHGILVSANYRAELLGNRIFRNGLLSIDWHSDGPDAIDALDSDAGRPNAPILASVREARPMGDLEIKGQFYGKPNTQVAVQFFASPRRQQFGLAEAMEVLGSTRVTTDPDGFGQFTFVSPRGGPVFDGWVAAAATAEEGTSELSASVPLDVASFDVTTVADSGPGSLRDVIARVNQAACSAESVCAIDFRVPEEELVDGVARVSPSTPLPALTQSHVYVNGASQQWYAEGRVEIGGTLQIGSESTHVTRVQVADVAIRGGEGDGVRGFSSTPSGIALLRIDVSESARGVVLTGARAITPHHEAAVGTIVQSNIHDNRGDGVWLEGAAYFVQATVRGNGGTGIFAARGAAVRVVSATVTNNSGAGIAAATDAVALYSDSPSFANGGIGIDRARTDDVPEIFSAKYDDFTGFTTVRARYPKQPGTYAITTPPSNWLVDVRFYRNGSGRSEGEQPRQHRVEGFEGDVTVFGVSGVSRGDFVTATRNVLYCYWEFGCAGLDTSEFSNAVRVE